MRFRTHVGRPMDFSLTSNRLVAVLVVVAGIAGLLLWLDNDDTNALWAPIHVFLAWALVREIDPDHDSTAIIASIAAGVWVLAGFEPASALAVGGFLLAARVVANTTGRRPLLTDLIVLAIFATAISFSAVGWVAGFGLAIALYVDDRMAEGGTVAGAITSALAALGASLVATFTGSFPRELPDIRPLFVVAIGLLALLAVIREPEAPTTLVDSRLKLPMSANRLHAARVLIGVLTFAAVTLAGPDAASLAVVAIGLALSLLSNELERLRRG